MKITLSAFFAVFVLLSFPLGVALQGEDLALTESEALVSPASAIDLVTEEPDGESVSDPKGSIPSRLRDLLKPVVDIGFLNEESDEGKRPEDQAAEAIDAPELVVTTELHPRAIALRYPVCSLHNPLYFEEPNLERCGNACGCVTTTFSALHFLSNTVLLPYRIASEPPCMTQCAAGDCKSCQRMPCQEPLRCRLHGALSEGAAAAGFVFLLL